ncbi:MAG: M56 family metallopeptidase [Clostridiales bacterium]|nr:M56 family metallopeptidase [Clostridiales bacterium]
MGIFASYTLSAGIYLLAGYLIYKWLLSSENQPGLNRALLLLIYVAAFLLPVLPHFRIMDQSVSEVAVGPLDEFIQLNVTAGTTPVEQPMQSHWITFLLWCYMCGMALTTVFSIVSVIRLVRIVGSGEHHCLDGHTLILLKGNRLAPFSWLRYIVMSERDYEADGEIIMRHEMAHLRLRHWIDLVVSQLVIIVMWYNPASWLMRNELRSVHEYQADSEVLKSGANSREYQLLLIRKAAGQRFPSLANSLNHSKLKTRITMMCNQTSSPARRLRALAIAPAFLVAAAVVNIPVVASAIDAAATAKLTVHKVSENPQAPQEKAANDQATGMSLTAEITDQMPQFKGGDKELLNYLARNVRYPAEAIEKGIQGNVIVSFVVNTEGKTQDVKVMKPVNPLLDAEAIRVISESTGWIPGRSGGKAVNCNMVVPVRFKLQDNNAQENKGVVVVSAGTVKKSDDGITVESVRTLKIHDADYRIDDVIKSGNVTIFVDNKPFNHDISILDKDKISSITVIKDNPQYPDGLVDIKLKGTPRPNPTIYLDGKLYEGDINSIPVSTIESISVEKSNKDFPNGLLRVTTKSAGNTDSK